MQLTDLPTFGAAPNGPKLRQEILKLFMYLDCQGVGAGNHPEAAALATAFTACASACTARVRVPVTAIAGVGAGVVAIGASKQLGYTTTPAAGSPGVNSRVTWSSANPANVAVNATGEVTRLKAGTTAITVTSVDDPARTATISIT